MTINRIQGNLQDWDKQLKDILEKKTKNGDLIVVSLLIMFNVEYHAPSS